MIRVLTDGCIYGAQKHGGISRYFTEILRHLAPHAGQVEMLVRLPARCKSVPDETRGVRLYRDWPLRPRRTFAPLVRWMSYQRAGLRRPSVFHSTYYSEAPFQRLRRVVTVYDMIHERDPEHFGQTAFVEAKRAAIESADLVIAISESTRQDVIRMLKVPERKTAVTHLAPGDVFRGESSREDLVAFRARHRLPARYWLFVGHRAFYKNFLTAVRALAAMPAGEEACLVCVGGRGAFGPDEEELMEAAGVRARVRLLPSLTDAEFKFAYAGSQALVFPSRAEGFGLPILEAMASGTPVICSDIPVFHEVAGEAATYVNPGDADAFADAMLALVDPAHRDAMIAKGRKRVADFSWARTTEETVTLYRRVVEG